MQKYTDWKPLQSSKNLSKLDPGQLNPIHKQFGLLQNLFEPILNQ